MIVPKTEHALSLRKSGIMKLYTLLPTFDAYLQEEGRAETTRSLYRWGVTQLIVALGPEATNSDVKPDAVRRLVEGYKVHHRPASVQSLLNGLRAFCRWLLAEGWVLEDVTAKIKNPKKDGSRRPIPTEEKVLAILNVHTRMPNPYRAALGRALVALFAYGGIRCAEVLNLRVVDVNFAGRSVYIHEGKGDKSRTVFLGRKAMAALEAYKEVRPQKNPSPYFFLRSENSRLGREMLYRILRDMATIAGYAGDRSLMPHSLRHDYVTNLLAQTGDDTAISQQVGHASVATTRDIYDHPSERRLRALAELAERRPTPDPPNQTGRRNVEHRRFQVQRIRPAQP